MDRKPSLISNITLRYALKHLTTFNVLPYFNFRMCLRQIVALKQSLKIYKKV